MNKNNKIPQKALELLPWYTMGKLSPEDHAFFQETLNTHPQLQQLLDDEREMKRIVSNDK